MGVRIKERGSLFLLRNIESSLISNPTPGSSPTYTDLLSVNIHPQSPPDVLEGQLQNSSRAIVSIESDPGYSLFPVLSRNAEN